MFGDLKKITKNTYFCIFVRITIVVHAVTHQSHNYMLGVVDPCITPTYIHVGKKFEQLVNLIKIRRYIRSLTRSQ